MSKPWKGIILAKSLKGPFYLRLSFLATRKRIHELLKAQLIGSLVLLQLIFNILLDFLFVLSYRIKQKGAVAQAPTKRPELLSQKALQLWSFALTLTVLMVEKRFPSAGH